jgi:hypothetical protein
LLVFDLHDSYAAVPRISNQVLTATSIDTRNRKFAGFAGMTPVHSKRRHCGCRPSRSRSVARGGLARGGRPGARDCNGRPVLGVDRCRNSRPPDCHGRSNAIRCLRRERRVARLDAGIRNCSVSNRLIWKPWESP